MDNRTFNQMIRPLNIEYCGMFGEIPRITDYSCTREEYILALKTALEKKMPLSMLLICRRNRYQDNVESET